MAIYGLEGELYKMYRDDDEINFYEMKTLVEKGYVLIDIRDKEEYLRYHIDGAINIPIYETVEKIKEVYSDKSTKIIIYCTTGVRSSVIKNKLKKLGYINILNLENGINN